MPKSAQAQLARYHHLVQMYRAKRQRIVGCQVNWGLDFGDAPLAKSFH
ncbi:hypothetical protein [Deinococcus frigens]|nr:hypothetical protein [Deinococcus frigens]